MVLSSKFNVNQKFLNFFLWKMHEFVQNMLCVFGPSDVCPMSLLSELAVFSKFFARKICPSLDCLSDLQESLKSGVVIVCKICVHFHQKVFRLCFWPFLAPIKFNVWKIAPVWAHSFFCNISVKSFLQFCTSSFGSDALLASSDLHHL